MPLAGPCTMPEGQQWCLGDSEVAHAWWRIPTNISACCLKLGFGLKQKTGSSPFISCKELLKIIDVYIQAFLFRGSIGALLAGWMGKLSLCTWPYSLWVDLLENCRRNHSQQTLCRSATQMHCCSWTRAHANSREVVFPVIHHLIFPSSRSCFFFTSAPLLNLGHRRCSILPSGLSFIRSTMFMCSNSNHKLLSLNAMPLETLSKGLCVFHHSCNSRKQSISFNNEKLIPTLSLKMVVNFCALDVIQAHYSCHFEQLNFL